MIPIVNLRLQVKIWFQNRRARERRDKKMAVPSLNPEQPPASTSLSPISISSSSHQLTGVSAMWSPNTDLCLPASTLRNNYAPLARQHDRFTGFQLHKSTAGGEMSRSSSAGSSAVFDNAKTDIVDDESWISRALKVLAKTSFFTRVCNGIYTKLDEACPASWVVGVFWHFQTLDKGARTVVKYTIWLDRPME